MRLVGPASNSGVIQLPDSTAPGGSGDDVTRLLVGGLCCDSEVALVRKRLERFDGVEILNISVVAKQVSVRHDPDTISPQALADSLSAAGLDSEVMQGARVMPEEKSGVPVLLIVTALLFALSLGSIAWSPLIWAGLAATLVGMGPIARRAWASVRSKLLDMNVLMTVAILGALAIGEWIEGAAVVTLFALSLFLEDRSMARARRAMGAVAELVPRTAKRAHTGVEVPVEEVAVGELIRVEVGARVPLDAVITKGRASLDESALTGESLPVERGQGEAISAGAMLVDGFIEAEVTAPASESAVAKLVDLVLEAQSERAPVERFVDRFARIYTPLVMLGAALLAVIPPLLFAAAWDVWIYRALVLLVVACPCALVIATPVTVVSGLARAARRGVLIKGGAHLETLGRVEALAFDKTGTLTEGRFAVHDCLTLGDYSEDEMHELLAVAEHGSSHPLAEALWKHSHSGAAHPVHEELSYQTLEGEGISVEHEGRTIHVGNHRMAERLGWHSEAEHAFFEKWSGQGRTVVYVGVDGALVGLHSLADVPRSEAARAVEALHGQGLELIMLTGDNAGTAEAIRSQVGLDSARAELRPADKVSAVERMRERRRVVAMVGDGINDAPALAAADVGIAMGVKGTAVAMETADVALMSDDLTRLSEVIDLGRRALRVIRINIAFALAVKALVLVLAVLGYASLWMAIAADVGATLLVILHGLTLLRGDVHSPTPPASAGVDLAGAEAGGNWPARRPADTGNLS